jgi:hypothetical protein
VLSGSFVTGSVMSMVPAVIIVRVGRIAMVAVVSLMRHTYSPDKKKILRDIS